MTGAAVLLARLAAGVVAFVRAHPDDRATADLLELAADVQLPEQAAAQAPDEEAERFWWDRA